MSPTSPVPGVHPKTPISGAALLEWFYARHGMPVPQTWTLRQEDVPGPYKQLLVHGRDMTPTLEAFYGSPLGIEVLSRERDGEFYLREVVLKTATRRPVEYGVIRILLNHLPEPARRHVLEEERPLGNILQTEGVAHLSWPQAFFRVQADPHMKSVLAAGEADVLYGRRNLLLDQSRHLLAEVIEVLAPASE